MAEGGKMRLRVPAHSARLTADCKQIKSVVLGYFWHKGKLVSRDKNQFNTEIPEASRVHPVIFYSKGFRLLSEASVDTTEAWRFGHAVPHRKYPLEFYPRYYWIAPDKPPEKAPPDVLWGVIGTRSPFTGRPFTPACDIVRAATETQADVVKGDFPKDYSDAMCRGHIAAVKGNKFITGMIDVWANNAANIDQIYNAAVAELQTYILED